MKIKIRGEGKKFVFYLPLSAGAISIVLKILRRKNSSVPDPKYVVPIIKEVKKYKRKYGGFTLVEIEEEDGSKIVITV